MLKPQAGMNDVRMIQPLRSVASLAGISLELSSTTLPLSLKEPELPRIMIWQRQLLTYEKSLDQLRMAIKAGFVLVSEFDDDPDPPPPPPPPLLSSLRADRPRLRMELVTDC